MSDLFDKATEREMQERQDSIDTVRRRVCGEGSALCIDCEESIPAARRRAMPSVVRCYDCQQRFELRNR